MRLTLLILLLSTLVGAVRSQDTLRPGQLMITDPVTNKKVPLEITELKCEVEVTGNRVLTTYYLTFYNPNNRDMEGTLEFPLGENENVVRFALEVNGNLREGVVVDKAKGQKVFEEIENRRVDPGLLEKTVGNNYRARVYPVPANGSKRLAIGCEKIIRPMKDEDMLISVPLVYNQTIKKFELNVNVYNESQVPIPEKNELVNITFEKWNNVYTAKKSMENFDARTVLKFTIPKKGNNEQILVEKNKDGNYVFSVSVFPEFTPQQKIKAKSPVIVWDASYSGTGRDVESEYKFIKAYLKNFANGNVKVQAVYFNDTKEKSFTIKEGVSTELIAWLKQIPFDGATRLDNFDLSPKGCDEVLFFSDGMSTYGKATFKTGKAAVIPVVSSASVDFYSLKYLAQTTGGKYIDLTTLTTDKALEAALTKPYRFIGLNNSVASEIYGDLALENGKSFTLTGMATTLPATLEMQFGIGDSVLKTHKVQISESQLTATESGMERIWALQKLNSLELLPQANKQKIIAHSQEWAVVSPYTSLIVLETLQDYIQYEIVPPEELKKEYFAHVENTRKEEEQSKKARLDQVNTMYQAKLQWYNMRYDDTIRLVIKENILKEKILKLQKELDTLRSSQFHHQRIVDSLGREIVRVDQEVIYTKWLLDSLHNPETHRVSYHSMRKKIDEELIRDYSVNYSESAKMMSESLNSMASSMREDAVMVARDEELNNSERNFERNRQEEITIKEWDPVSPYMTELKETSVENLYATYLLLRENYLTSASFYLDVAEYFIKKDKKKEAILILSNLAELKNEDCPFIRILATRYSQIGEEKYAVELFKRALELRPYEPQSYRDLGLALAKTKNYQEAVDTLYQVALRTWDSRFPEVENIVLTEMNSIIATCGKKLDLSKMDERLLVAMPSDIRIVLTWDSDHVDIDLHTVDPNNQECSYSNKRTRIGGRNSNDFTGGYGPEEFMAHYAMNGIYKMKIKYYGERSVTLLGPTTIMIQVFTNYGKPDQKVQEFTRRLETTGEWLEVGEVKFGK